MRTYAYVVLNAGQREVAVFSTNDFAQRFIAEEKAKGTDDGLHYTIWPVDERAKRSWFQLNQPAPANDASIKPREDCHLIGYPSRRGSVAGFSPNPAISPAEGLLRAQEAESRRAQVEAYEDEVVRSRSPHWRSLFYADNYTVRHTQGHNMLDPEAFFTQGELDEGFTANNSFRDFPDQETYERAARGYLTLADILTEGPRVFRSELFERG